MDRQDLPLEELPVPEPIRLPLHRLDLVVRPLHRTAADHDIVVRQQPAPVPRERLGHLLEDPDPRRLGPADPPVEERGGEPLPRLLPEPPEVLLQVVGRRQRLVELQRLVQPLLLVLFPGEVRGVLQQQPPRPLWDLLVLHVGRLALQGPPPPAGASAWRGCRCTCCHGGGGRRRSPPWTVSPAPPTGRPPTCPWPPPRSQPRWAAAASRTASAHRRPCRRRRRRRRRCPGPGPPSGSDAPAPRRSRRWRWPAGA